MLSAAQAGEQNFGFRAGRWANSQSHSLHFDVTLLARLAAEHAMEQYLPTSDARLRV